MLICPRAGGLCRNRLTELSLTVCSGQGGRGGGGGGGISAFGR